MIFAWLGLLLAGAALLASRAATQGYLLVIRSRRHDLILMERRADDRYHLFAPYWIPFVLARFAVMSAMYSLLQLRRRGVVWNNRPGKRMPLAAKA